jgi:hypothetical protein
MLCGEVVQVEEVFLLHWQKLLCLLGSRRTGALSIIEIVGCWFHDDQTCVFVDQF